MLVNLFGFSLPIPSCFVKNISALYVALLGLVPPLLVTLTILIYAFRYSLSCIVCIWYYVSDQRNTIVHASHMNLFEYLACRYMCMATMHLTRKICCTSNQLCFVPRCAFSPTAAATVLASGCYLCTPLISDCKLLRNGLLMVEVCSWFFFMTSANYLKSVIHV